ncbi:unnamed protein product, partial [Toxocara canis]|uniref:SERPIN domain-containing protein n=1 Tax=Toxocara canis TaxID=6265 RepID=A0A183TZ01_TOXCA
IQVSVIAQTEYFPYYSDQTLSAIAIPYEGDKVVMYIFLPNERHGLSTLEKTFTAKKLFRIIRNMKRTHVDVILPKFRLEKKTDLQRALNRLGIIDGFGEEANFTGICSAPLSLSTLIHEAVSESGTKGTTNVEEFKWKFIPISSSEPAEFIADHPFLFAILHDDTLLFIGHFRG